MVPQPIPLHKDYQKLLNCASSYDASNPNAGKLRYIANILGVTDNEFAEAIENFQKDPKELLKAINFILQNKQNNAEYFYTQKKKFFRSLILSTLSSLYREKRCDPELYFYVLEKMKKLFESTNLLS